MECFRKVCCPVAVAIDQLLFLSLYCPSLHSVRRPLHTVTQYTVHCFSVCPSVFLNILYRAMCIV